MFSRDNISEAFHAALPIVLGYIAIGLPCGILSASIGMNALQVFIMCLLLYSGAGQFMIPNMWIAGSPIAAIIASVSLVNTRQMLYSASFAPHFSNARKRLSFWFAATVTDESFGVNMQRFAASVPGTPSEWTPQKATLVNEFSHASWTISCVVGVFIGNALGIPLAIAAFAMTSIFICLLVTQKITVANVIAAVCAIIGVFVCKLVGLAGPAILIGAVFGVVCAIVFSNVKRRTAPPLSASEPPETAPGKEVG